jgi:magnesium transporter
MDHVKAYLYDATGEDKEISIEEIDPGRLAEKQLLWVNLVKRDKAVLEKLVQILKIEHVPIDRVIDDSHRPDLDRFETFFRFCTNSVVVEKGKAPQKQMIDYVVGKNFVLTVHEGEVASFNEFIERQKGETPIGELDAESFLATLLDLNIVTYFRAVEQLERRVDKTDEKILKKELETEEFLKEMVDLRRDASRLRRWLMPHREVFYALSRADFHQIAESDSAEEFRMLNQHFESAVDAVEHSRDQVLSVFELYATKSSQMTNTFVQRLTFLTLLTGSLAVIAGILGMNFKADIFDAQNGFWMTVAGLAVVAVVLTIYARFKRWI